MNPSSFTISEDVEHSTHAYKMQFGLSIIREWDKMKGFFSKKIQYISDPFYEAYSKSASKLSSVIDAEPLDESGTFISKASSKEYNTIFYKIKTSGIGKDFNIEALILFFSKDVDKEKPSLNILIHKYDKGSKLFLSEVAGKSGVTEISILADIISMILFMKYVELETKIVKAERREHHAGVKYVNETKHNVEILDSTWFTTIVRSEGFKVSPHFRMQAYGENHSQRKLIWIDPFDKTGYTRTAKILNTHD